MEALGMTIPAVDTNTPEKYALRDFDPPYVGSGQNQ
jgi:hypothetical protein